MKLIDKYALVAEIESLKSAAETMLTGKTDLSYWKAQKCLCERFLSFIDTLEVKEVDYDKEITEYLNNFEYANIGHRLSLRRCAKHFLELGLKVAQKGE